MTSLLVNMAFLALCLNVDLPARRRAMAERRAVSLLDCAIAASVAVVPVLLGVVAAGRGRAPGRPRQPLAPGPQRPLRQRPPRRGAADLRARDRAPRPRRSRAPVTTDDVLDGLAPCRREWGGATGAQAVAAPLRPRRRRRRAAGRAGRRPARASSTPRCCASAARANGRVEHRVGVDAARWFAAAADALATPLETPDAPGQRFQVRCADLAGALAALRARRRARCSRPSPGAAAKARRRSRAGGPSSRCASRRAR